MASENTKHPCRFLVTSSMSGIALGLIIIKGLLSVRLRVARMRANAELRKIMQENPNAFQSVDELNVVAETARQKDGAKLDMLGRRRSEFVSGPFDPLHSAMARARIRRMETERIRARLIAMRKDSVMTSDTSESSLLTQKPVKVPTVSESARFWVKGVGGKVLNGLVLLCALTVCVCGHTLRVQTGATATVVHHIGLPTKAGESAAVAAAPQFSWQDFFAYEAAWISTAVLVFIAVLSIWKYMFRRAAGKFGLVEGEILFDAPTMGHDVTRLRLVDLWMRILMWILFVTALLMLAGVSLAIMFTSASFLATVLVFSFKEPFLDMFVGLSLQLQPHGFVSTGDWITVLPVNVSGVIERFDLTTTAIRCFDGRLVTICNRHLRAGTLTNHSSSDFSHVEFKFGMPSMPTEMVHDFMSKVTSSLMEINEVIPTPSPLISPCEFEQSLLAKEPEATSPNVQHLVFKVTFFVPFGALRVKRLRGGATVVFGKTLQFRQEAGRVRKRTMLIVRDIAMEYISRLEESKRSALKPKHEKPQASRQAAKEPTPSQSTHSASGVSETQQEIDKARDIFQHLLNAGTSSDTPDANASRAEASDPVDAVS